MRMRCVIVLLYEDYDYDDDDDDDDAFRLSFDISLWSQ